MTLSLSQKLQRLNIICEIKEELLILWRELSTSSKQNKKHQQSLVRLLTDTETLKNKQNKELENEQK